MDLNLITVIKRRLLENIHINLVTWYTQYMNKNQTYNMHYTEQMTKLCKLGTYFCNSEDNMTHNEARSGLSDPINHKLVIPTELMVNHIKHVLGNCAPYPGDTVDHTIGANSRFIIEKARHNQYTIYDRHR